MDQTPLPFIYDDGKTYATKGSRDVLCATGSSGLDKRQCTTQLTVFSDGVLRVQPTLIFRGKGLRTKEDERKQWDRQPNAWCDEEVMKDWIKTEWSNYFRNPPMPGSTGKILVADVHRAQQTTTVKTFLNRAKTQLVNVPSGLMPYVQVLDVSVNLPFKNRVKTLSEDHLNDNLVFIHKWQNKTLYPHNKVVWGG